MTAPPTGSPVPTEAETRTRARQLRADGAPPHDAARQARAEAWAASSAHEDAWFDGQQTTPPAAGR